MKTNNALIGDIGEVDTGVVFYAFNTAMIPVSKNKYHLCGDPDRFCFMIQSKEHNFSFCLTPDNCNILEKNSYIDFRTLHLCKKSDFKIEKTSLINSAILPDLVEKATIYTKFTLPPWQQKMVKEAFEKL